MENVPDLAEAIADGVSDADWICEWFRENNYTVIQLCIDARLHGSLPRRERIYWLAVDGSEDY